MKSANPLIDLYQYSGDRSVKICEMCGQKFIAKRNLKTCSDKCSELLRKRNGKREQV